MLFSKSSGRLYPNGIWNTLMTQLNFIGKEEDGGNDQITIEGHPSPSPSVSNTTQADGSGEDKAESRPNKSQFYNLCRKVFTITATTGHLYSGLTNVEMVGMQSPEDLHYPESIEELPLRSPDDEPSSLQE
ncbi:protein NRT1/ PTR FAMILY 5.4-like [Fagus crenata]